MTGTGFERTVAELVRQVEHRYHGKYRGLVVDNDDPEHLGRLTAQVPSVLGDEVVTGWALPCVPYGGQAGQGLFAIPGPGAGVWIEFEEGDLEFPIWVGTFWSKPGGASEVPHPTDRTGTASDAPAPPTRRVLTTARGHTIQIEDAQGQEMILIHEAAHARTIVMDGDGVTITDGGGNTIAMTADHFTVTSKKKFTINASGGAVEIVAATVAFTKG
jgi:uncharacterized protein involved in type VI secretion and phage assembly